MTTIDQVLQMRSIVGRLREAARVATSKRKREDLRAMAKKIERRRELNLSTSWWCNKAEEMMK